MCDDYVGFITWGSDTEKITNAFTFYQIDQGDKLHLSECLQDSFGYGTALESVTESAIRASKRRGTQSSLLRGGKQGARLDQTSGDRGAALQQHKVNCAHLTMNCIGNINIDKTCIYLLQIKNSTLLVKLGNQKKRLDMVEKQVSAQQSELQEKEEKIVVARANVTRVQEQIRFKLAVRYSKMSPQ
jgi:hypothetical protein